MATGVISVTEEEACRIIASAWNRLEPDDLIAALDENVRYSSQAVPTDMRGKDEVAQYLRLKMKTIRSSPPAKVFAYLAETQPFPMCPNPSRPRVVLAQGNPDNHVATVLFTVAGSKIASINMGYIPSLYTMKRLGESPPSVRSNRKPFSGRQS